MSAVAVGTAVAGAAVSYGLNKALNSGASKAAENSNQAVADSTALQSQISQDQWNRYKEIYTPLENKLVADASNYASPEQYQRSAGDASATVAQQFGKARDQLTRTPGLDPSSPAYAASIAGLDQAQAASDATQQNAARTNVLNTSYARKTDAVSLGKGLPAASMQGLNGANYANLGLTTLDSKIATGNAQAIGGLVNTVINPTTVKAASNWLSGPSTNSATTYAIDPNSQIAATPLD
jgi:hypothetical protein